MGTKKPRREIGAAEAAQFPEVLEDTEIEETQPWELIDADAGRYLPRRIRGSFRGRALG